MAATAAVVVLTCMSRVVGAAPGDRVRDVGPMVGFRAHESSYSISVGDTNGDGWPDLLIGHHGSRPAELFLNQPDGHGGTLGFEVVYHLVDDLHARPDRHGCIMGDPNRDDLIDFYCTKGAHQGHSKKWNELWIQGPAGYWRNEAALWRVEDHWGRGRYAAWIDLNHDRWPDLFVGNDVPRHDRHTTPNRTFENVRGVRFDEVNVGVTVEQGGGCAQAVDLDDDGWDDLLVCGRQQLLFYRGGPRGFRRANERFGVPTAPAITAEIADVSGDGTPDLVVVYPRLLTVWLADEARRFTELVHSSPLGHGHGLAIGDIDGRNGPDIYAVDGCVDRANIEDTLLMNGGDGRSWRATALPGGRLEGCGDTAETIDFDRDGRDDFVVVNGGGPSQPLDLDGPDQLLTMGDWRPPS